LYSNKENSDTEYMPYS